MRCLMYYVLLAEGFEEIEALTQTDVLRRAGIAVKNVGVTGMTVTGAHGISVRADIALSEACRDEAADGVILPGGLPGTTNLAADDDVKALIRRMADNGKLVAAICAAPSVLGEMKLLEGRSATCYPGFEDKLIGAKISRDRVVRDGNFITSRGIGTAMDLALALTEYITGTSSEKLSRNMIYEQA